MLRTSNYPVQIESAWTATRWALCVGLLALLVVFSPTWIAMAKVWATSETFGHGVAVVPIALWLIWRQRAQLKTLPPSVSWIGVASLAVCCLGWLIAQLAGINVVAQFAFTGMVASLVLALTGWSVSRSLAFPLLFLFFMVPAGEALNPPLMDWTANATVWALKASGLPVYREGMNFSLPTGNWSVVEACSGLRYVLAAGMLGALFAYLNFDRWLQRLAFFGVSIGVAVVANWMRAYLIVMVGHFSQMKRGVGEEHVVYGWVFFGITMFVLFWMGAKWRDSGAARPMVEQASKGGTVANPASVNASGWQATASALDGIKAAAHAKDRRRSVLAAALVVISMTLLALSQLRNVTPDNTFEARAQRAFSTLMLGRLSVQPTFNGARAKIQGVVDSAQGTEIYLAYFARQEDGAEMIAFGNDVVPAQESAWQVVSRRPVTIELEGRQTTVMEWRLRQDQQERLLWHWYSIAGREVVSDYKAKALTAWSMLTGQGDHSVVCVMSTRLTSSTSQTFGRDDAQALQGARGRLQLVAERVHQLTAR